MIHDYPVKGRFDVTNSVFRVYSLGKYAFDVKKSSVSNLDVSWGLRLVGRVYRLDNPVKQLMRYFCFCFRFCLTRSPKQLVVR